MNTKKTFLPIVVVGTAILLIRRLLAGPSPAKSTAQLTSHEEIEAYIGQQMRRLKIPGLALAIIEGERVVYQRGFGNVRPASGAPSPKTLFSVGSTTKSFPLAAMQLV